MNSKKFFLILLVILLLSGGGVFGTFYLGNNQLQDKYNTISNLIADRDISQEKILRLEKAKKDAESTGNIDSLLERLLPSTKQQDKLIADIIYTSTAQAGIPFSQVTTFSFSGSTEPNSLSGTTPSKDYPGVYEYPFNLSITGITYNTLILLLQQIENNGRILQVDNVQISTASSGDTNLLNINLAMKAYLKP